MTNKFTMLENRMAAKEILPSRVHRAAPRDTALKAKKRGQTVARPRFIASA